MRRSAEPPPQSFAIGSLIGCLLAGAWLAPESLAASALKWEQHHGSRVARLAVPATGRPGFTLLTPGQSGVFFTNQLSYERSLTNQNLLNGAGVCAGDFDGDGWVDVYFCNLEGANGLFRNLGDWKFQNVTAAAGAACAHQASRGSAFADVTGDGWPDLIVTSLSGPNALLVNDGQGHFKDLTADAGLVLMKAGCESLALADIDGNGTLDLYIANNGDNSVLRSGGSISVRMVGGKPQVVGRAALRMKIVDGQLMEFGVPDVLYLNDGQGRFTAASWTDGTFLSEDGQPLKDVPRDLGLTAAFRDLNGDGFPDLYVCNDFQTPDRIWLNDGHGRFRAMPDLALRTTPHFSMCLDFADIDRDGFDDFICNDMLSRFHRLRMTQIGATNPTASLVGLPMDRHQERRNVLHLNRGDGTYAEIANFADVAASDWTWCVAFLDVDLDGHEDLLAVNGHAYDTQDLDMHDREPTAPGMSPNMRGGKDLKDYPALLTPNFLFHNRRDRTFKEVGAAWGFNSTNVCHGLALADFDNDGDLDVAVSCLGAPPLLYRNESPAPRIAVRLKGKSPNTAGIGAKITVRGTSVPTQSQEIQCGGRYLSGDQPMRVFAAGSLTNQLAIEVKWRSGLRSVIPNAEANCLYEIDEAAAQPAPAANLKSRISDLKLSEDVSDRLAHSHSESAFNDLERQPLLPKMLSRFGPGVAWHDLDGDGHDELIVGAGRGGSLAVFRTDGKGGFTRWASPLWNAPAPDDLTGLVSWTPAAGQRALLAAVSRYETDPVTAPAVLRFDAGASAPQPAFAAVPDLLSPGPLAVADIDGDGDLDLFVGGRVAPGRYPEPVASKLFRNDAGKLVSDAANNAVLKNAGLVSGAVFSDLDGDGLPELILACEWGPVRVFKNTAGTFTEITAALGLDQFIGWWNGVTTGDLDGDGHLDIIASNWGLNSSYHQPTPQQPARSYYGDFDDNGVVDLVEAETDWETGQIVPRRDLALLSVGWPLLRTRFATHRQFSVADINTVLGDAAAKAKQVQATTLASMLFLNRGARFEARPLPPEAQFAPAFAVCVADFDGDGHEDVFLSQNFFSMRLEEPRLDAGRGLWLRGDGAGQLTPVPGQISGVLVYGEQRGAALADFDEDGRIDLVVSQNNGATKLYRNMGAKPGLRVRLQGPPANPAAIGACVRLLSGAKPGAARELHAGSGYWSQDSPVQVLAAAETPTKLWVRWPGGKTTTTELPSGARSVVVETSGTVSSR
ncbi:MAG: VCBS repeat-containing protein [Verrucomicrobia bacterium]|nr:VCBS repeat-containing protein [Verrucomicrobiota bacterium]